MENFVREKWRLSQLRTLDAQLLLALSVLYAEISLDGEGQPTALQPGIYFPTKTTLHPLR